MWTWQQLTGSPSLDRIVIAELWAGLIVYISRNSINVGAPMMLVSLATLAWAVLMKGFYWRNSDSEPGPLLAGRMILVAIGIVWLVASVYFLRLSPQL
jgi:hypothetical protein